MQWISSAVRRVAAVAVVFVPRGLRRRRLGRLQRDARGDFGVRAAAPRRAREGAPHQRGRLGRRVPVRARVHRRAVRAHHRGRELRGTGGRARRTVVYER